MKFKHTWLLRVFIVLSLLPSCVSAYMVENSRQGAFAVFEEITPGDDPTKSFSDAGEPATKTKSSRPSIFSNRNRYYNPKVGRFTSADPIGFARDNNLYRYANDNPLSYSDPFGEGLIASGIAGILGYSSCKINEDDCYIAFNESISNAFHNMVALQEEISTGTLKYRGDPGKTYESHKQLARNRLKKCLDSADGDYDAQRAASIERNVEEMAGQKWPFPR